MMRRLVLVSGLFGALAAAADINVRDYGAVGDGVADDTAALQRAADAAFEIGGEDAQCMSLHALGGTDGPFTAVTFPAGTYRIRDTINFRRNVALLGEAGATIVHARPDKTTFHCREAHRLIVKDLAFDGGAVQVRCWTKNRDVAYFHVSDCTFRRASQVAVVCDCYKNKNTGPSESGTIPCNNSTLILVEKCRFADNATAVHLYSDGTTVRDCQFVAPERASREQIRAGSGGILGVEMNFRDSTIVYPKGAAPGTAAIRYDGGRVTFENVDIRAEGDLIAVRSYSHFNEYGTPSMLDLINMRLATGDAPVVSLEDDDFPNRILAYDLKNERGGRKRLMAFEREVTAAALDEKMANAQYARGIPAEQCLAFTTRGLDPERFDTSLPPLLERYRKNAIPADWKRPLHPRSGSLFATELPGGKVFRDDTIGRRRREKPGDDTEKVAKLLAAVEAAGGGIVELPARWIRVSHGFRLPDKTLITCRGRAALELTERDGSVFTVEKGGAIDAACERILFVEGGSALTVRARKGRVRFLDCAFYGQKNFAIHASADAPNDFRIEVTGGQAYEPYLYCGNGETTFDAFWFEEQTERPAGVFRPSYASIVNEAGGRLILRELLGVPCYYVNYPKSCGWDANVDPRKNGEIRWIDNHGTLLSLSCRYGGEWGGLTPIYHFGKAKTHLEGGVVEMYGRLMRSHTATVVADSPRPDVTICRGVAADWKNPVEVAWKMPDGNYAVAEGVRQADCSPFTDYSPVWPRDPGAARATQTRFVAAFDWAGGGPICLELKVAHAAKVWLNGAYVGEEDFCAPWGQTRIKTWSLSPRRGRNLLAVEVQNACTNAVHGGAIQPYLDALVVAGEHVLAWSAVDGHFRALPPDVPEEGWQVKSVSASDALRLKRCHNLYAVKKSDAATFESPAGLNEPTTLFFAGDSTLDDHGYSRGGRMAYPYYSWGTQLQKSMKACSRVANFARSGASTKSFSASGRWAELLREVKRGDFVVIQFGHNDQKRKTDFERAERWADPNGLFREIIRGWVADVRGKGAVPILVSPICRARFDEAGKRLIDVEHATPGVCLGTYRDAMKALAAELGCDFVDLNALTRDLFERLGRKETEKFFVISTGLVKGKDGEPAKDTTHPIQAGAEAIAQLFLEDVTRRGLSVARLFKSRDFSIADYGAKP